MTKAKNIKATRVSAGLTQEQVARKADVTLRTYIRYESSNRMPKDADKKRRLCRALGLPVTP